MQQVQTQPPHSGTIARFWYRYIGTERPGIHAVCLEKPLDNVSLPQGMTYANLDFIYANGVELGTRYYDFDRGLLVFTNSSKSSLASITENGIQAQQAMGWTLVMEQR